LSQQLQQEVYNKEVLKVLTKLVFL